MSLVEFVKEVIISKSTSGDPYHIGVISERLRDDISSLLAEDFSDYNISITKNAIKHINKRHGSSSQQDKTMSDINDIGRIGFIFENYDTVAIAKSEKGNDVRNKNYYNRDNTYSKELVFEKQIDGVIVVTTASACICANIYYTYLKKIINKKIK